MTRNQQIMLAIAVALSVASLVVVVGVVLHLLEGALVMLELIAGGLEHAALNTP